MWRKRLALVDVLGYCWAVTMVWRHYERPLEATVASIAAEKSQLCRSFCVCSVVDAKVLSVSPIIPARPIGRPCTISSRSALLSRRHVSFITTTQALPTQRATLRNSLIRPIDTFHAGFIGYNTWHKVSRRHHKGRFASAMLSSTRAIICCYRCHPAATFLYKRI